MRSSSTAGSVSSIYPTEGIRGGVALHEERKTRAAIEPRVLIPSGDLPLLRDLNVEEGIMSSDHAVTTRKG